MFDKVDIFNKQDDLSKTYRFFFKKDGGHHEEKNSFDYIIF